MWPPVTRFAIAFTAGLWTAVFFSFPPVATLVVAIAIVALGCRLGWRHRIVGAVLAGAALGAAAAQRDRLSCAQQWRPGRHAAVVRIHDAPGARGSATGTVLHTPEGCAGDIRLRLDSAVVPSGATVVLVGEVRANGWLRVRHFRRLRRAARWRFRIRDIVGRRIHDLYGQRAPLVEAMVLGRRADLDPEVREQFIDGGLAHLLAISGLHVGIITAWLRLIVGTIAGARAGWHVSALAAWLYVALLGFPAPATRAATFIALATVGRMRERRPPSSAVIAVSVLVILSFDPNAVRSVGAWLSLAAVAGASLAPRIARLDRGGSKLSRLAVVSLGATLATAPITAYSFGSVAPIGVVANLVAVPLAGVAVPAVFASLFAGAFMAVGAGLTLTLLERVARWAGHVPWGHLEGEPGWPFAMPWIGLLGVVLWATWRRPSFGTTRRRLALAVALSSWGLVAWPAAGGGDDGLLAIHVLAVGQGDAIALRTPRGRWILVDGGPRLGQSDAGRSTVLPFLRRRGVRRLDAVFVSHGDADHLGGLPTVIEHTAPALVVEPGQALGTALYMEFLGVVDAAAGEWRVARAGDTVVIDSVTIAVLHPSAEWMSRQVSANENSLILHVRYRNFDALFTGDAGWPAESALATSLPPVDLLKVGHHGSAGSTSNVLLDAVRPKAAVISVGSNRFGHPTRSVLRRLQENRVVLYRTDQGGTVTIRTNGSYFEVVQGQSISVMERVRCVFPMWSRSSDLSSNKSACTRTPRVSSRTFSTTSR